MDISNFRATITGDFARPNLFRVTINLPGGLAASNAGNKFGNKLSFTCSAAQIPGSTVNKVPVQYMGREVYFAGNRIFADWTLRILNDEDFVVRRAFEDWMKALNTHITNVRRAGFEGPNDYVADAYVEHLGKAGPEKVIAIYKMVSAWPTDITPIELDWSTNDIPEDFNVTMSMDAWETVSSISGESTLTTIPFIE